MIKGRPKAGKRPSKAGRARKPRRSQRSLPSHPVFVPLLTVWGAALGGLLVLVLPQTLMAEMAAPSAGAVTVGQFRLALAGMAAIVFGGLCLALATTLRQQSRLHATAPSIARMAARRVRPIDPVRDLGTASLDTPLDLPPLELAGEAPEFQTAPSSKSDKPLFTRRDFEDALIKTCEAMADDRAAISPNAGPATHAEPAQHEPHELPDPIELDLSQFAQIPGRNAVWVEEHPATPQAAHRPALRAVPPRPRPPRPPQPVVVEQLRAVPASELSLVQMVERLAAALHERQTRPDTLPVGRDAALAEALKALAFLANEGTSPHVPGPGSDGGTLRDALARLHDLRGAA